jgi:hypothetical protein
MIAQGVQKCSSWFRSNSSLLVINVEDDLNRSGYRTSCPIYFRRGSMRVSDQMVGECGPGSRDPYALQKSSPALVIRPARAVSSLFIFVRHIFSSVAEAFRGKQGSKAVASPTRVPMNELLC